MNIDDFSFEDDFEDDFEDESSQNEIETHDTEEDTPLKETSSNKPKGVNSKAKSTQKETSEKKINLKKIGIISGITVGVISLSLLSFGVGRITAPQIDTGVKTVEGIKSQNEVIENLETIKDSQIQSYASRFEKLEKEIFKSGKKPSPADIKNALVLTEAGDASKPIEDFVSQMMSIKYNASEQDLDAARNEIAKSMTKDAAVSSSNEIVRGGSAAKQLNENGKKSSKSIITLINQVDDKTGVYLVISPFTTEKQTTSQISIVAMTDKLISGYQYVGLIDSVDPTVLYQSIAAASK